MTAEADGDDRRLPYRDDDPDDVHTKASEAVDPAVAATSAPDAWADAATAIARAREADQERDEAIAHLHLDLGHPVREVAHRLGLTPPAVVLACRVRK